MRIYIRANSRPRTSASRPAFAPFVGVARRGSGAGSRSAVNGFTLLEMLVALAIFSLAALALVRLQAVSVRTAADLDQRTLAEIVARNLAFERITDPLPPGEGDTSGTVENGGRNWHWAQAARPTMDGRLMAITIRVDAGAGQSPAVLSFVKPVPMPGRGGQ